MPRIVGSVLGIEDVPPYVNRETGQIIRGASRRLVVLEDLDAIRVNLPDTFPIGQLPAKGEPIAVEVEIRAYVMRGNANLAYTARHLLPVEPSAGRRTAPAPAA